MLNKVRKIFETIKISELNKKIFESMIARGGSFVSLFAMHSTLAISLGPSDYGVFNYILSVSAVLSLIACAGWQAAIIRFINEYLERRQWSLLSGAVMKSFQLVFFISLLIVFILFVCLNSGFIPGERHPLFFFTLIIIPLMALSQLRDRVFISLKKMIESIFFSEIALPILVVMLVYLGLVNNANSLLTFYSLLLLFLFGLGSYWLWRQLPIESKVKPTYNTKYWVREAFPLLFAGVAQLIMNRTAVLILGYLGDMEAVGILSLSNRIAILITFVMVSVNAIGAPMLSSAYYKGDNKQFQSIFFSTILWSTLGALPPFLFIFFFPEIVLDFFGSQFVSGKTILKILSFGYFINAATGLVGSALTMTGRQRIFGKVTIAVCFFNFITCFLCSKAFGVIGAAFVYSFSIIAFNVLLLLIVVREFNLKAVFYKWFDQDTKS